MKKRTNPRNHPASKADVQRSYNAGIESCLALVCWTLKEKMNATQEYIARFNREFNRQCELIEDGYVTEEEIREAMKNEYDLEVEVR